VDKLQIEANEFMSGKEINTLSCIMSFILIILMSFMIICLPQTFGSVERTYSNGNSENFEEVEGTQIVDQNLRITPTKFEVTGNVGNNTTNSEPQFTRLDNNSKIISLDFPALGNDSLISCNSIFKCTPSFSTGWKDNTSFKISTNNTNNTTSSIYGEEIAVKSKEYYKLVTHMKLNQYSTQPHVVFEGFNETSKLWYQINQCPSGINGPLEWHEFTCIISIPENTTKIRPELNAGWSSQPGKQATTWFDSVYLIKLGDYFVTDPNLHVERFTRGLNLPTSMAFSGPDEILVLEKDNGTVRKIINGTLQAKPILDVPVATIEERGMLGIEVSRNENNDRKYVFLYFTESGTGNDGDDITVKKEPLGNRLYRYELNDRGKLVNPKLLLDLPAIPWPYHNGGALTIGPDNNIYIVIGDGTIDTQTNNVGNGSLPDGRSAVLRITQDGKPVSNNGILGNKYPLNLYYAYGIRNSFGIDFDPVGGNLWDTENGPNFGDELNLVKPSFNSGWKKVQGLWTVGPWDPVSESEKKGNLTLDAPHNLVDFNGRGQYSPPKLTWNHTIGPTAIKFLTTDKLGEKYRNDMLVSGEGTPKVYHFKLNQNRTELLLQGSLADKVADSNDELDNMIFAKLGGASITDLDVGPDGYLYLLSIWGGTIYRIVPSEIK
jgi:glucose/arabinose dehydrogenase